MVDTYATLAAAMFLNANSYEELIGNKGGRIKGVIHYLAMYETLYHWRKGSRRGLMAKAR